MHSERDYLVKFVFPELKERCLKRGLHLVDVDLRWGVAEEEAEHGKVLDICMDEIENCRPFFIGLLGERYGWTPENYEVPDHQKYDWLKTYEKGHSVTALEIYHGVLKNPEMKTRAFFFFRDSEFINDVPQSKRSEVTAESPEAGKKMNKY
jgi:telomerase protein component 1